MGSDLIANIDLKFSSGNSIPVERASITRKEWEELRGMLTAPVDDVSNTTPKPPVDLQLDLIDQHSKEAGDAGIERDARELLAAECESYSGDLAQFVRSVKYGGDVPINSAIRATAAALRQRVSGGRWILLSERSPERNATTVYWHRSEFGGFPAVADEWRDEHHAAYATHWLDIDPPIAHACVEFLK